jgi:1-deoxy-D-xylulose-5-phosphate reductoisomerase
MGRRITVDSALLFNKGLELIEAHVLFDDFPWEKLDAVLHPQALVHAMVTFTDGSMMLQAAPPDMKIPIRAAIAWPGRRANPNPNLKATDLAGLTFEPIPAGRYPALDIALEAGRAGGTAPCVLNAADEIAVEAFLDGAITLGQVPEIVRRVVEAHTPEPVESLAQLDAIDAVARRAARESVVRA